MIPYLDLKAENFGLKVAMGQAIAQVIDTADFILGDNVAAFEEDLAGYMHNKYAVTVGSGTDALIIAIEAAGIGPGDEVITTPFTFVATIEAILRAGATPVFADIDRCSFNIDTNDVAGKITPNTKAILAVNLFGQPCDVVGLRELCDQHELKLIFDSAQAFGAKYDGKPLSNYADTTIFSFFPSKVLGGFGDGGAIVTDDILVKRAAQRLRNHGSRHKLEYHHVGHNSRLDEIQAAVLRIKLDHVDYFLEHRKRCARAYQECLQGVKGIQVPYGHGHAWNIFTIKVKHDRESLRKYLAVNEVQSRVYYRTLVSDLLPYAEYHKAPGYPSAVRMSQAVLSLPLGLHITTEDIGDICNLITTWASV